MAGVKVNNKKRRMERIKDAVREYSAGSRFAADRKAAVIDILTDLRHYCEVAGYDFKHLDALAYSHYCEEDGAVKEIA